MKSKTSSPASDQKVRLRSQLACSHCRLKRTKCSFDERSSQCKLCIKLDVECVLDDPVQGKKVPPGYLAALEERVAFLQAQMSQSSTRASSPIQKSLHKMKTRPRPTRSGASKPSEHYLGPSSGRALARRLLNTISLTEGAASNFAQPAAVANLATTRDADTPSSSVPESSSPLFSTSLPPPAPMPPPELMGILIEACFNHIQLRHPFLHLQTFLDHHASLGQSNASPAAHFLVFGVFCVGARVSNQENPPPEAYLSTALSYFEDAMAGEETLESIQALLVLAVYSLRSPRGPGVWQLIGLAMTRAISMGLHREDQRDWSLAGLLDSSTTKAASLSPLEIEMRRRVWWTLYSIDVSTAVMLGRPTGIADECITTPLPVEIDSHEFDNKLILKLQQGQAPAFPLTSMSAAIHSIRLRRIEAEILRLVYGDGPQLVASERLDEVMASLTVWWTSTPRNDPARPGVPNALTPWYDMRFHQTVLLAHSPSLLTALPGDRVIETCAISSMAVCHLSEGRTGTCFPLTFPLLSLHSSFLAGLTLLLTVRIEPTRPGLDVPSLVAAIDSCQATLLAFESKWPTAILYSSIMRALRAQIFPLIIGIAPQAFVPHVLQDQQTTSPMDESNSEGTVNDVTTPLDLWATLVGAAVADPKSGAGFGGTFPLGPASTMTFPELGDGALPDFSWGADGVAKEGEGTEFWNFLDNMVVDLEPYQLQEIFNDDIGGGGGF